MQVDDVLCQFDGVDAVACDLHPDLHATRLAEQLSSRLNIPLIRVQHHHAHIASVMAEHGVDEPVVGLAMDGYGYGEDGSAWGGECLYVDIDGCTRIGCIKPVAMPGGDAASRQPWRMAVAWLDDLMLCERLFPGCPVKAIHQLCHSESTPVTSSAGRLFDAVSAILLGIEKGLFEGEAAIALERAARGVTASPHLTYNIDAVDGIYQLDCKETLIRLAAAVEMGESRVELAAGFHCMLASGMAEIAIRVARQHGFGRVALSGGCFHNLILKKEVTSQLEDAGVQVLASQLVPQGDGAIALGQAWVAAMRLQQGDS